MIPSATLFTMSIYVAARVFMLSALFLAAHSVSAGAVTDTVKCKVTGAKRDSIFSPFVDGQIIIDLANGNSLLSHVDRESSIEAQIISSETVSSFSVPRKNCNLGIDKVVRHDGSLRAMIFTFDDCLYHDPDQPNIYGYVRAQVGFDLTENYGRYSEILLTPRGPVPSAFVDFQDCKFQGKR
jgi:hypothetical protein